MEYCAYHMLANATTQIFFRKCTCSDVIIIIIIIIIIYLFIFNLFFSGSQVHNGRSVGYTTKRLNIPSLSLETWIEKYKTHKTMSVPLKGAFIALFYSPLQNGLIKSSIFHSRGIDGHN